MRQTILVLLCSSVLVDANTIAFYDRTGEEEVTPYYYVEPITEELLEQLDHDPSSSPVDDQSLIEPTHEFFSSHSCIGGNHCLLKNVCRDMHGKFLYLKSPLTIHETPPKHVISKKTGEYQFTDDETLQELEKEVGPVLANLGDWGIVNGKYRHFRTSRVFWELRGLLGNSSLSRPTASSLTREMKVVDGGGEYQAQLASSLAHRNPMYGDDLDSSQWHAGQFGYHNGKKNFTKKPRERSEGPERSFSDPVPPFPFDDHIGKDRGSGASTQETVHVLMGRLWPQDMGHQLMDNIGPIIKGLRYWNLLDLSENDLFGRDEVSKEGAARMRVIKKIDRLEGQLYAQGLVTPFWDSRNNLQYPFISDERDFEKVFNLYQGTIDSEEAELSIVRPFRVIGPEIEKLPRPQQQYFKTSGAWEKMLRTSDELLNRTTSNATILETRWHSMTERLFTSRKRKSRRRSRLILHLQPSITDGSHPPIFLDPRYGRPTKELESRLMQMLVDGDRSRIVEGNLPRGYCFRKMLIGWRTMPYMQVESLWDEWSIAGPARAVFALGQTPDFVNSYRSYVLHKLGFLDRPEFLDKIYRRKWLAVDLAKKRDSATKTVKYVDRIRPHVLILAKRRGGHSNCCFWDDVEEVRDHLLKAFDWKIDVSIRTWSGVTVDQQILGMADADIVLSFAGVDIMNFMFSPEYSALICPYRYRNGRWERSYEIDRLWANLKYRYIRQFGITPVGRLGQPTLNDEKIRLGPWRRDSVRGNTIGGGFLNLTEQSERGYIWPRMTMDPLLRKELEVYVGESVEYMRLNGVVFHEWPESINVFQRKRRMSTKKKRRTRGTECRPDKTGRPALLQRKNIQAVSNPAIPRELPIYYATSLEYGVEASVHAS